MTTEPGPGSHGFPLPPSYGPPAYGPPTYGPLPAPSGYLPVPYGHAQQNHADLLAATADRDRTIDVLRAAYVEGRLTKDEFDARSGRVMSARTYGDLAAIVADLPSGPGSPVPVHGYYPQVAPVPQTSGLAIGALVCGLAEFFTFGIAAVPAVILGHLARAQIKQTGERGDSMAVAGLVLGYMGIIGWMFMLLFIAGHS